MVPTVARRRQALEERYPSWEPRRLDQHLDAAAEEFPDRPYVITDERSWTYREIQRWSVRIASGLAQAGVLPGQHVAVVMANYPEFVAVKYGIARAGATCVPVNFLNRRDELAYVLEQSDAVALVTMDRFRGLDYLGMLDELAPGWERRRGRQPAEPAGWEEHRGRQPAEPAGWEEHRGQQPAERIDGERLAGLRQVVVFPTSSDGGRTGAFTLDELAAEDGRAITEVNAGATADVLYTSGTTGQPKGVVLTHDMLLRTAYGSAFARAFADGHRITFSLPMYHVFGYVEGMLAATFVGGAIVPQLAFDAANTARAIERHRATDALLIPTMSSTLLDELDAADTAGRSYELSSLTSLLASGGVPPAGLWDRIERAFAAVEVSTGYGMSETTASTTVTRPDDPPERRSTTNGRLREVGVAGDPSLGGRLVDYRVVDARTRAELPRGQVGELLARGPGVTPGYYRKPEETAEAFADGSLDGWAWLRTGDLGWLDSDDYLVLAGRVKESYRCGGEQVMPKEVEDVLTAYPGVAQAHVVPLPDQRMGEVGVAFVVPRDGARVAPDELIAFCAERLARFKVPRHVLTVAADDIPSTPSGRPRKFLLARRAAERLGVTA